MIPGILGLQAREHVKLFPACAERSQQFAAFKPDPCCLPLLPPVH